MTATWTFSSQMVFMSNWNSRANSTGNDGGMNHWIALDLVGTVSNRSAVGAKVWAEATIDGQDVTQLREISAGGNGQDTGGTCASTSGSATPTTVDTLPSNGHPVPCRS